MKRNIIGVMSVLVFCFCENSVKKDQESKSQPKTFEEFAFQQMKYNVEMQKEIENAIASSDTVAYHKIAQRYFTASKENEFLVYALEMAYKNNCAEGYYHVYKIIARSTPKDPRDAFQIMNKKSKNLALYHLLRSYEMGYKHAKFEIHEVFGIKSNAKYPESSYYLIELVREYTNN